jgi:catechol 2,3-dioxygenase-like lactoylglutathione lyase family enzyme
MPRTFQLTFDCADARSLAAFWADVLGYRPADPPAGFATWEDWLRHHDVPEEEWGEGASIEDPNGGGSRSRITFLNVPEPKTAKNRIHMDLDVADRTAPIEEQVRDIDREVARVESLGGTKVRADRIPTHYHVVMQDPEGNEFCVR